MAKKKFGGKWKTITLEEMVAYIEENAPEDKAWFKKIAYENKTGETQEKYNHLNAKRKFCEKYAPEIIPVAKPKEPPKSDLLKDW